MPPCVCRGRCTLLYMPPCVYLRVYNGVYTRVYLRVYKGVYTRVYLRCKPLRVYLRCKPLRVYLRCTTVVCTRVSQGVQRWYVPGYPLGETSAQTALRSLGETSAQTVPLLLSRFTVGQILLLLPSSRFTVGQVLIPGCYSRFTVGFIPDVLVRQCSLWRDSLPFITRFTVGGYSCSSIPQPFHCWTRNTRFTVGHTPDPWPPNPLKVEYS